LPSAFKAEPEERDEDHEQSGGEGFGLGLGEPTIFADKGKPGFYGLKPETLWKSASLAILKLICDLVLRHLLPIVKCSKTT
jgi:hypothetical protein